MNGARLRIVAALASVGTALTLVTIKLLWWGRTGAVSLLGSAVDSALDLLSSAIILAALVAAARPADNEHRYGHGKAEALAGFAQSLFISASAGFVMFRAIRGLLYPESLAELGGGIVVMFVAIGLTALLVAFQTFVAKRTGSTAIRADRLHYTSDLLSGLAVVLALEVERRFAIGWADFAGGMLIAAYVFYSSVRLFRESFDVLMDRDVSHLFRTSIDDFVKGRSGVLGYHDLRSRSAGDRHFLELHLEIDRAFSFDESHRLVEELIEELQKRHENLDVTVHSDPSRYDPLQGTVELPEPRNTQFR